MGRRAERRRRRCLTPTRSNVSTHQTQHDLAEKHVLERLERPRIPVVRLGETLKRLEEVRVRRLVVLVVRVDCSGLQVEGGLEERRAVYRVGSGSGGRESGLGEVWASANTLGGGQGAAGREHLIVWSRSAHLCPGEVLDRMSRSRLEEEHLGEDDLVVELLELFQQVLSHGEGGSVVAGVYLSGHVRQHCD
jgi:hypothetical protein